MFLYAIVQLKKIKNEKQCSVVEIITTTLKQIAYKDHLQSITTKKSEADDKWQNVKEFIKIAQEFEEHCSAQDMENKLTLFLRHIGKCHPLCNVIGKLKQND